MRRVTHLPVSAAVERDPGFDERGSEEVVHRLVVGFRLGGRFRGRGGVTGEHLIRNVNALQGVTKVCGGGGRAFDQGWPLVVQHRGKQQCSAGFRYDITHHEQTNCSGCFPSAAWGVVTPCTTRVYSFSKHGFSKHGFSKHQSTCRGGFEWAKRAALCA